TIANTTVSGNLVGEFGGGIFNSGTATIANTTVSGNLASEGSGIYNPGVMTVTNSTISGNMARTAGGACFNAGGTLEITNSTCSNNSADHGSGILNDGSLEIGNTILNAGAAGGQIFDNSGSIVSQGHNLCSDNGGGFLTGPGDQINTDPLLGPLQNNGGPT